MIVWQVAANLERSKEGDRMGHDHFGAGGNPQFS